MHRILCEIGSFSVYSYGVCVAAAFLISTLLIRRDCVRSGLPFDKVLDCLLWILVGGLIGGRLLFVCTDLKYYLQFPMRIFAIRDGGMAFHGGLAAGTAAAAIVCRRKEMSFAETSDIIAPYIALGQAVGRVGCFLNGCCYGKVVRSGFGVTFPGEVSMRLPVQAYAALGLAVMYLALLRVRGAKLFSGSTILLYLVMYSIFRFFIEFLRGDNPSVAFGMTLPQVISASMFTVSVILFTVLFAVKRVKR